MKKTFTLTGQGFTEVKFRGTAFCLYIHILKELELVGLKNQNTEGRDLGNLATTSGCGADEGGGVFLLAV